MNSKLELVTFGQGRSFASMARTKGVSREDFEEFLANSASSVLDGIKNPYLRKISEGVLGATDGTEELKDGGDPFVYVDSDFKNWGVTTKPAFATKPWKWKGYELVKDGTFLQFLGENPNSWEGMPQVVKFVRENEDKLQGNGSANFFPLKGGFVAGVYRDSDGWYVYVRRLSDDGVWGAVSGRRVFVPQLKN